MDIAAWLRELGLQRYEPVFRDNEIDWEVLPELTEADLEKLGLPLGPREKLLKAIAGLSGKPTAASTEVAPSPRPASPEAERRQLTVMFVDLVGSTALSAQLDPEEMRQVIRGYQNAVAGEITRFKGYVAKYMGDGVLAFFGYPRAQEDDGERAVRAALAVMDEVGKLRPYGDLRLQARLGIATGLVVVGDLVGEGAAREEAVVGETPNLAARLQQLADPGTIVVADSTRRLLGQLFDVGDLGARALHGFPAPVRAWQVVGEGRTMGRFEARRSADLTPLVGRENEVALLLDRWKLAREGEGHAVLLAGEPGVGKSRVSEDLRQRLGDQPHLRLLYQCSPQHTGSALHPISAQLEHAAGFLRDDEPAARLAKLESLLAHGTEDVTAVAPLFAGLLAIPFTRRAAETAQGTGEAKDALAQMGIALRDQSGNLRRSEDLLADVANAFVRIEDPAERVRLAFKLFDSEGVALVNLLSDGSGALDRARHVRGDLALAGASDVSLCPSGMERP